MSSVSLQNCNLASLNTIQKTIFAIENVQVLNIDNFTVNNTDMEVELAQYNLVYISAVKNVTISNVNLVNSKIDGHYRTDIFGINIFCITDNIDQGNSNHYPTYLNITGWVLQGLSNFYGSTLIYCSFADFSDFGGGLIQDFFISESQLSDSSYILSLNVQDPTTYTLRVTTQSFTITNFTIADSSVTSLSAVGYLNFYGTTIIEEQELVYINVTSLTSIGNIFTNAYFFQVVGMCTY
jgi:hypothetical protein